MHSQAALLDDPGHLAIEAENTPADVLLGMFADAGGVRFSSDPSGALLILTVAGESHAASGATLAGAARSLWSTCPPDVRARCREGVNR